jgi:ELWxxDGT repeat protein
MKIFRPVCLTVPSVILGIMIALPANGQILANRVIADLNPGSSGSYPTNLFVYKNKLVFSASTVATGREPWEFDGTNVSLIADINPVVTSGVGYDSSPGGFTVYSNALYFSAYESTNGNELYRYDGTNVSRVTDINPGAGSAFPQQLTVMGNELFFSANSGSAKANYELWKYNGSTAIQVTNIYPDSGSDYSSYPSGLAVFNGALYFSANDGTHGYELWKASSTNAILLKDINTGSGDSFPQYFTAFNNQLYFSAATDAYGYELWQTDGTNTSQVTDLNPGSASSYPQYLTVFNNALYFQANDATNGYELWKYNGSSMTLVSNINLTGDSFPKNLTVFSNQLFFAADDGLHGWELWKCDGTNASMVADLNPSGDSFPEDLTVFGNALYFVATTPDNGYEWWKYDGSDVTLAADINPGSGNSYPQTPVVYGNYLCFSATADGVSNWEPWTIWFAPFRFISISPTPNGIQITWTTVGGHTNIIQSSDTVNGNFTNLSDSIVIQGNGEIVTNYLDVTDQSTRFYRAVQP